MDEIKDEYVCNDFFHSRWKICYNFDLHAWDPEDSRRLEARAFWMAITHALGEMETCIRHDDETFEKDPFSSRT